MDAELVARLRAEMDYEEARTAPPEGFPRFPDLPAGRYIDPAFFELERASIWSRSWMLAVHADELPEVGSFVLWEDAGAPVLIVRGQDRKVRAFYNTCRHRGAPVVRERSGQVSRLRCQYHSWTYDLEGRLVAVPDACDFVDLDRSCRALVALRCESWGPWVFVNQDPGAAPLLESLASIPEEMREFEPQSLRLVDKHGFDLACNWKVAIEAFLEVYHLKHIHPRSVNQLLDHRRSAMGLLRGGHSRMVTAKRPERVGEAEVPQGLPDIPGVGTLARITNVAYFAFPNLVTPLDSTGFPFLLFWPRDIRRTRMEVLWFGPCWEGDELPAFWKQFIPIFDVVLREDTENLAWIQTSLDSAGFRGVPLGYQERRIYHFHEQVDRAIGPERIPEVLRVESCVGPYVERPR